MVSFLHAADLHLGLRVTRFDARSAQRIREARFKALDDILLLARDDPPDFLIIAGDLFDDHAVDNVVASRCFAILHDAPRPVFILPGNHDPLLPGSVWDRPPWNQANPKKVCLLRKNEPVEAAPGVQLFPCPVLRKTSLNDPTRWIADAPPDGSLRIGVAHGSLKVRDDLPSDDHLIARTAARDLRLDYLALGHWHRRQLFPEADGAIRTAYCGVHEPMRFQGSGDPHTGWLPYSTGGNRAEFLDDGKGEVLRVRLAGPGAAPEVEPLEVGHLVWQEEARELRREEDLSRLIADVATRPLPERRLLRLRLTGVLDAQAMQRLGELQQVLEGRYFLGELDTDGLHLEPTEEQMREAVGPGILGRVLQRLRDEARDGKPEEQRVAERALLLLYQLAHEVRA